MAAVSSLIKKMREGTATKEDEVQILDQIAKAAEEGCAYIARLLSPDMIGWVRAQMQADIYPNVMERIDDEVDRRATAEARTMDFAQKLKEREAFILEQEELRQKEDEEAAEKLQGVRDMYDSLKAQHQELIESSLLDERKLRAVRRVAGDAWLDEQSTVSLTALKTALASTPPTFPEWSGTNPHAFDYAEPR